MKCNLCTKLNINIKTIKPNEFEEFDLLKVLIQHVDEEIRQETFDDQQNVQKKFGNLITHCCPKKYPIPSKQILVDEYNKRRANNTIMKNDIFEKLIMEVTNGEVCVSVPSKALDSCPFNCAFCPTGKNEDGLVVAKSYTMGQPVFYNLVKNENNLHKYLLQHMVLLYCTRWNMTKLAMRHLGGTFSTYTKLYRLQYCRDIFYITNIFSDIINDPELLSIAKESLQGIFDPDNILINKVRKPFNFEEIERLEKALDNAKIIDIEDNNLEFNKHKHFVVSKLEDLLEQAYKKSLQLEQEYNVTARVKVVALSVETRPDTINNTSVAELLKLGVTIVEIGLQSPNNEILKINKRGHTVEDSIRAIRMLKDNGFHVHAHWMFDLCGSTKESDLEGIIEITQNKNLRCDQMKVYPLLDAEGTETTEWRNSKKYISYLENDYDGFINNMVHLMSTIDKTTRIVRVQRDLPKKSAKVPDGYTNNQPTNLEQIVTNKVYESGKTREDIRYHEPGTRYANIEDIKYSITINKPDGGIDIYIEAFSYVCNDVKKKVKDFRIVWGYCRLRIVNENTRVIKFFQNDNKYGRIRELKVNGSVESVGKDGKSVQHRGIGSKLLKIAEEMAYYNGMTHVTVTSAVGVRDYYRLKHGYELDDCGLMWKKLVNTKKINLKKINENEFIVDENKSDLTKYLSTGATILSISAIVFIIYKRIRLVKY